MSTKRALADRAIAEHLQTLLDVSESLRTIASSDEHATFDRRNLVQNAIIYTEHCLSCMRLLCNTPK